jgi:hypothetical protein
MKHRICFVHSVYLVCYNSEIAGMHLPSPENQLLKDPERKDTNTEFVRKL